MRKSSHVEWPDYDFGIDSVSHGMDVGVFGICGTGVVLQDADYLRHDGVTDFFSFCVLWKDNLFFQLTIVA